MTYKINLKEFNTLVEWLLKNGNPIVRYRTLKELTDTPDKSEIMKASSELMEYPYVQKWLSLYDPNTWNIHGSNPSAHENILGKFYELGLSSEFPAIRENFKPIIDRLPFQQEWFDGNGNRTTFFSPHFAATIYSASLCGLGFFEEIAGFKDFITKLVAVPYKTAKDKKYDMYTPANKIKKKIPKAFQGRPLISDFLVSYLPVTIHDLRLVSYLQKQALSSSLQRMANVIAEFILNDRFEKEIQEGYGVGFHPTMDKSFWGCGWSPHLPGKNRQLQIGDPKADGVLVQRTELMSNLKIAGKSAWFTEMVKYLSEQRTEAGTFLFKSDYLPELKAGYYVKGAYTGLGENRKKKNGLEIESTFRMLRILKNSQLVK
jgi:hypothetical protein